MSRTLFISLVSIALFSFAHEYYVSVFNLKFNKDAKQIECELKVFTDDLEFLLKSEGYGVFALGKEEGQIKINQSLKEELLKTFAYTDAKGKEKPIHFVGYEVEGDLTRLFFTIDNVKSVKTPNLKIDWMLNLFNAQVNIVHFNNGQKELSEYFNADKQQIKFQFSE